MDGWVSERATKNGRHGAGSWQIPSLRWQARPLLIAPSRVAHTKISVELGALAVATTRKVVGRKCSYGPVLAYPGTWRNRGGGTQSTNRENNILNTARPQRSCEQTAKNGRRGAESQQVSSPGWRARPPLIVSLKSSLYQHRWRAWRASNRYFVKSRRPEV